MDSTTLFSALSMDWLSFLLSRCARFSFFPASVQKAEDRGNKYQRGDGRAQQAADDGAAEGSVLFPSVSQAQRHRNHPDDHCQCGHDDWAKPGKSRFDRRFHRISVMLEPFVGER